MGTTTSTETATKGTAGKAATVHIRVPVPARLHDELRHVAIDLHVPLYQLLVDGAVMVLRKHREKQKTGTTAQ